MENQDNALHDSKQSDENVQDKDQVTLIKVKKARRQQFELTLQNGRRR